MLNLLAKKRFEATVIIDDHRLSWSGFSQSEFTDCGPTEETFMPVPGLEKQRRKMFLCLEY